MSCLLDFSSFCFTSTRYFYVYLYRLKGRHLMWEIFTNLLHVALMYSVRFQFSIFFRCFYCQKLFKNRPREESIPESVNNFVSIWIFLMGSEIKRVTANNFLRFLMDCPKNKEKKARVNKNKCLEPVCYYLNIFRIWVRALK